MHRGELWEEREKEHARRDRAYAKVLRWAKCGMFKGKRAEREGQSDKAGARPDQQAPLDRGEELGFSLQALVSRGRLWAGVGVDRMGLESSGSALQDGL